MSQRTDSVPRSLSSTTTARTVDRRPASTQGFLSVAPGIPSTGTTRVWISSASSGGAATVNVDDAVAVRPLSSVALGVTVWTPSRRPVPTQHRRKRFSIRRGGGEPSTRTRAPSFAAVPPAVRTENAYWPSASPFAVTGEVQGSHASSSMPHSMARPGGSVATVQVAEPVSV